MKNEDKPMNTVCEINRCAGCMACFEVCKQNAIRIEDSLKAYNAVIDQEKCVHCNACHRVCPNNSSVDYIKPIKWYQGWAEDKECRIAGSSGGIAQALAHYIISVGGCVCSCVFDKGEFVFRIVETEGEIKRFTGSKYVKSNPKGIYRLIRNKLDENKRVLFIGLPCQVAAVQKLIPEKLKSNLFTVDLICHGTPSPQILSRFLSDHECPIDNLEEIEFRSKARFQVREGLKSIGAKGVRDRYTSAFLSGISYTDNCYSCKYADLARVSDITLGDSWGSELDDNEKAKGISLILCQTEKGIKLIERADICLHDVNLEMAVQHNHQLVRPSSEPDKREFFFEKLKQGERFDDVVYKCYPRECLRQDIKAILVKLGIMGGGNI